MIKSVKVKAVCLGITTLLMVLSVPGLVKAGTSRSGSGHTKTPCGFDVTTVIADSDASNLPMQIQSDGLGEYQTSTGGVTSQIMSGCDWALNLMNQASRTVNLTFDYPLPSNGLPAPFAGTQMLPVGIVSNCQNNPANSSNFGTMQGGQTLNCPMDVAFYYEYDGVTSQYHILMEPNNYPQSTWAQVACTSAFGSPCSSWTVAPSSTNPSTGEPAVIGALVVEASSGGKGKVTTKFLGYYYFAFGFTISN